VLLVAVPVCQAAAASYDLIIRNGHIIDGTGSPWYAADVGIRASRIAALGSLGNAAATRIVDVHGLVSLARERFCAAQDFRGNKAGDPPRR
jgi:N-acyl-D-amino-acid deacylase